MGKIKSLQRYQWSTGYRHDESVETSDTIIKQTVVSGLYEIDALPIKGDWLRFLALELDEPIRDQFIRSFEKFTALRQQYKIARVFTLEDARTIRSTATLTIPVTVDYKIAREEPCNEWALSSEEILGKLEGLDSSLEDRITAVLFAETVRFNETEKPKFLDALFAFAIAHRFSKDDQLITAVGAAIRKFAMNISESRLEDFALLFARTETDTLSCDIELELAKAASWRLINSIGEHPTLEASLSELASDYLVPRLILQKNYASIVIHAVIGVALLSGSRQNEFVDRIAGLRIQWFSDLFARRLLDATAKREATAQGNADNLKRLHDRLIATRA